MAKLELEISGCQIQSFMADGIEIASDSFKKIIETKGDASMKLSEITLLLDTMSGALKDNEDGK